MSERQRSAAKPQPTQQMQLNTEMSDSILFTEQQSNINKICADLEEWLLSTEQLSNQTNILNQKKIFDILKFNQNMAILINFILFPTFYSVQKNWEKVFPDIHF